MAIIIPFPRIHRDYEYKIDNCAGCKKILDENEETTEIFNHEGKTADYYCKTCSTSFFKEIENPNKVNQLKGHIF